MTYKLNISKHSAHSKIIELVGGNKKLLDVGCSSGGLSRMFKEKGCYVVGVEVNKDDAVKAKESCDRIIVGNIEDIEIKEKFDVIVLADVLEHLKDPLNVLKKLKKNLTNNGYIVVSVPNIANWSIRIRLLLGKFDYTEFGILDKSHLRFFTLKTLKRLLNDAGYHIIRLDITPNMPFITYRNTTEGLSYFLTKRWKGLLGNQFIVVAGLS